MNNNNVKLLLTSLLLMASTISSMEVPLAKEYEISSLIPAPIVSLNIDNKTNHNFLLLIKHDGFKRKRKIMPNEEIKNIPITMLRMQEEESEPIKKVKANPLGIIKEIPVESAEFAPPYPLFLLDRNTKQLYKFDLSIEKQYSEISVEISLSRNGSIKNKVKEIIHEGIITEVQDTYKIDLILDGDDLNDSEIDFTGSVYS